MPSSTLLCITVQHQIRKGAISDEKGLFYIDKLPYGNYTVKLTYIGYTTVEKRSAWPKTEGT